MKPRYSIPVALLAALLTLALFATSFAHAVAAAERLATADILPLAVSTEPNPNSNNAMHRRTENKIRAEMGHDNAGAVDTKTSDQQGGAPMHVRLAKRQIGARALTTVAWTTRKPRPRPVRRTTSKARTSTRTPTRTRTTTVPPLPPPSPPTPPAPPAAPQKYHYGVAVQFGTDTVQAYVNRVGFVPTMWTTYERISNSFNIGNPVGLAWALASLGQPRNSLTIVMQLFPDCGITCVTDSGISQMIEALRQINNMGIKVILCPYAEANGYWFAHGNQPALFVSSFRKIVDSVRRAGIDPTMVKFGVHLMEGSTYPWGPSRFDPLLDTNKDGQLDRGDDPYLPYYPGDAYVDWIGCSAYHFGIEWPWDVNEVAPAGKLYGQITGTLGEGSRPPGAGFDLHAFAVSRGKKFAIFETSASFYTSYNPGPGKLAMMRAWQKQAYGLELKQRLPGLGLVVWFEFIKYEEGTIRDFRATFDGMANELRNNLNFSMIAKPGELGI